MAAPVGEAKMHPHPDHGEESYTGSGKLLGRTALITGGDSGIGRAVALCYAKEGADVLFTWPGVCSHFQPGIAGIVPSAGSGWSQRLTSMGPVG